MELLLFLCAGAVFVAGLGHQQVDLSRLLFKASQKLFYFPERSIKRLHLKLLLRQKESFKSCECCSKHIRQSDTLCAACKLEISLGKSIQIGKKKY